MLLRKVWVLFQCTVLLVLGVFAYSRHMLRLALMAMRPSLLGRAYRARACFILCVFSLSLLAACSSLPPTNNQPAVSVSMPDNHRMHFRGKGAGAGMMLMSSMGPMGIAIGVAIDEGIAKDIGASAAAAGVDVKALTEHAFSQYRGETLHIVVERYGFVTAPRAEGVDDAVLPTIILGWSHVGMGSDEGRGENSGEFSDEDSVGGNRISLEGAVASGCVLTAQPLASIKTDGEQVRRSFVEALGCLVLWFEAGEGSE